MEYQIKFEDEVIGTFTSDKDPKWILENFEPIADELYGTIEDTIPPEPIPETKGNKLEMEGKPNELYVMIFDRNQKVYKKFHILDAEVDKDNNVSLELNRGYRVDEIIVPYMDRFFKGFAGKYIIWTSPDRKDIDDIERLFK